MSSVSHADYRNLPEIRLKAKPWIYILMYYIITCYRVVLRHFRHWRNFVIFDFLTWRRQLTNWRHVKFSHGKIYYFFFIFSKPTYKICFNHHNNMTPYIQNNIERVWRWKMKKYSIVTKKIFYSLKQSLCHSSKFVHFMLQNTIIWC